MIFIFLDSTQICIERIKERVLKGGHNVPDNDVIRRFSRGNKNFWNNYRLEADYWYLVYNSENKFKEVAIGIKYNYSIIDSGVFKKYQKLIK